jgi:uncharacterized protein YfcZ (UPF0381/DUF406 family)
MKNKDKKKKKQNQTQPCDVNPKIEQVNDEYKKKLQQCVKRITKWLY